MSYIKAGTASTDSITQVGDTSGTMEVLGSSGFGLKVKSDGRVYGDKLHNVGTVTGTTDQFIASGTYTPTLTLVSNVDSATPSVCQWIRVGNVVTVSGGMVINITTTLSTFQIGISLPIASSLTSQGQVGGTICSTDGQFSAAIIADAANDRAQVYGTGVSTTSNYDNGFSFTYLIL